MSQIRLLFVLSTILLSCASAQAQDYSPADILTYEDVQDELKMTEQQVKKIQAIDDAQKNVFKKFIDRLRAAETEEERSKIRGELQAERTNLSKNRQKNLLAVLSSAQQTQLNAVAIRRLGPKAFTTNAFTKDLNLTAEQSEKIKGLYSEYRRLPRDDRDDKAEEYEGKILQVFDAGQRKQWLAKIGSGSAAAMASTGGPSASGANATPAASAGTVSFGESNVEIQKFDPNAKMPFNIIGAPWSQVLNSFATRAGFTLDMKDVPDGSFTYRGNDTLYTAIEALDIMNGWLITRGYLLVRRGKFLVCMNYDQGVPPNVVPVIQPDELAERGANELVTVEFDVTGIEDLNRAANEVSLMLGPYGFQQVRGMEAAGKLLVTGLSKNLNRISTLLSAAKRTKPGDKTFKSIALIYADAEEAADMLETMLGQAKEVPNVSAVNDRSQSRFSRTPAPARPTTPAANTSNENPAQIMAYVPTNSVLVSGTQAQVETAEQMLKAIDVSTTGDGTAVIRGGNKPQLRVYKVTSADATEVTKTLSAIIPGVVVNEDGRNGKIHIMATPREHAKVEQYIRQLDGSGMGSNTTLDVIFLKRADPISAAMQLRSLFLADGEDAPAIEPDLAQRSLMVRGSAMQVAEIRKFLTMQGEDGIRDADYLRRSRPQGPVRSLNLYGRDPDEVMQRIKMLWSGPNPVQIIEPKDRRQNRDRDDSARLQREPGPIRTSSRSQENSQPTPRPPARTQPQDKSDYNPFEKRRIGSGDVYAPTVFLPTPQSGEQPQREPRQRLSEKQLSDFFGLDSAPRANQAGAVVQQQAGPGRSIPQRQPPANADRARFEDRPVPSSAAPIQITRDGDNIIIMSTDIEALDKLQDEIDMLTQSLTPKDQWRVRYLTVADATEVSLMIEQLMPQSSVSSAAPSDGSIFSSISGFGSDLANITGLSSLGQGPTTLRIIPEVRSNSLWINGPASLVDQALTIIETLDTSELPESLRDRKPRFIEVQYADVLDVEEDIKLLYKDFLEAQGGGKQQNANPFAAMMGGGGGSKGSAADREAAKIRMTIAVDERSSRLIISAKDALFQEVKGVVEEMDETARKMNRKVVVVPVEPNTINSIQDSIRSIMPRVSVTSGGASTSNNRPSGGASSAQSNAQQAMQDAMRARFGGGVGGRTGGATGRTGATGRGTGGRTGGGTTGGRGFGGRGFGGGRGR